MPYQNLPNPPSEMTAANLLSRLIDAIGYRFHLATDGMSDAEMDFRPVEGSMNMQELLLHMYRVLFFAYRSFNSEATGRKELESFEDYQSAILELAAAFSADVKQLSNEELAKVTVYLKRTDTHYSVWYLINGPIGDILTHIGQINSWRRMAGNPVPRVSPFTGEAY